MTTTQQEKYEKMKDKVKVDEVDECVSGLTLGLHGHHPAGGGEVLGGQGDAWGFGGRNRS